MSSLLNLIPCFAKLNSVSKQRFSSQVQKTDKPTQPSSSDSSQAPKDFVKVTAARKRMFVFFGLFKNTKDIPDIVSIHTMARTMDKFRVRVSIMIMAICAVGAVTSVVLAKGLVDDIEGEKDKKK